MKIITLSCAACLVGSLLNAQIVVTENFEGSSAGSATPPAGWSLVNKTGSPSYATSAAGLGSNGAGGSAGLAGRVSSTAFVDTNLAGGYLVNHTAFSLSSQVTGTFDFQIVHEDVYDDVTFMLGALADGYDKTALGNGTPGEFLTVKLTEAASEGVSNSISNGYGRDQTATNDRLGQLVTNNILLADDTWYRARVTWIPTSGTTGDFSITVSDFSTNLFTLTKTGFTFSSANGNIGFGSVNDTVRFDNINFTDEIVDVSQEGAIVSLNQIGYHTTAPKRFTAPLAANGQSFQITSVAQPATVLFDGTITGTLGDFTAFQPASAGPYVISYKAPGHLRVSSYPFLIQVDLIEEKLVKPAIDFMVDSRSGVGTHPSAFGGAPWRDGCYYSFEVPSLIYLHLNARNASNQKVGQIHFNAEKATVLAPSFDATYVTKNNSGDFLTELRRYYQTYDAPLPGCPDALAAVHFGLGVTMAQPSGTKDPSGDPLPKHLHSQTREWFAWFLYAWPVLREHLPDSFYAACRDFTFANWSASSGLSDTDLTNNQPSPLDIDPLWNPSSYGGHNLHPIKGRHAPGHSILPNLLLWQVALREGRSDANTYLAAAQAQTQWIIDNLDWNNPLTTKGQRMSEYKMMTGLVHFLRNHPQQAPPGLAAKIEQWADVMISRSGNMWDYRRYELTDTDGDGVIDWSVPKQTANWNEPGNLAGFPACALAAAWTLDHAPEKQRRLREISQSAIDCLFGRNPLNAGSCSTPALGFPDQESPWPVTHTGEAAYLEFSRGTLASGPGSEHFPYNPSAPKRWTEGWVNFNAAFNMGLSYMLADKSPVPEPLAAPFPLVISEILAEPAGNALAEFIELYNPTSEPVRLEGLTLAGDVSFAVPTGTASLSPGGRCLIVRDQAAFEATHGSGLPVIGTFSGDLDDSGAVLRLGDVNGNTFLTLDRAGLPQTPGHSQTLGQSGWRISASQNGSPGGTDSIPFAGEPSGDTDHDGVPNLIHHAVTGMDRAYVAPQISRTGSGVTVSVTRNLAADDTPLALEWCSDLINWQNAGVPGTVSTSGDRLAEWTFSLPQQPNPFFIRLKASH